MPKSLARILVNVRTKRFKLDYLNDLGKFAIALTRIPARPFWHGSVIHGCYFLVFVLYVHWRPVICTYTTKNKIIAA